MGYSPLSSARGRCRSLVRLALTLMTRVKPVFFALGLLLSSQFLLAKEHSVTVTWSHQTGLTYNVYRCDSTGKGCLLLASKVESGKFVDKHVKAGQSYRYKITAVDHAGHESSASEINASVPENAKKR